MTWPILPATASNSKGWPLCALGLSLWREHAFQRLSPWPLRNKPPFFCSKRVIDQSDQLLLFYQFFSFITRNLIRKTLYRLISRLREIAHLYLKYYSAQWFCHCIKYRSRRLLLWMLEKPRQTHQMETVFPRDVLKCWLFFCRYQRFDVRRHKYWHGMSSFGTNTENVTGETLVLNKNLPTALSWKSWENRVCTDKKQGLSQHKAGKKTFLAPEFHQSRLQ